MSNICRECAVGISSADYNAENNTCSSCLLDNQRYMEQDAEKIVKALIDRRDSETIYEMAIRYSTKYLS